eukprot:TRINITY_DN1694_c0_g1_i2.p2 TRINITY_DN1694_c0_g1~~TRINITY_DN1694_c0_g1_i2.p2  ORF type:complete len:366 (-),score=135.66 TRINITY_DN1694_c0_g1_i2:44-1141(-)
MSYIFAALTVICILVIIWMRKKIIIAIELIEEATICMNACPELIFLPVLLFGIYVVFLVYWVAISLFLASAKQYNTATKDFEYSSDMQNMVIYHFFGFLWTTNFITAVGYITIAGTAATWYFTKYTDAECTEKATLEEGQTWKSLDRTCRHHLGSAAFGSLILALAQAARALLEYIETRMEEAGLDNFMFKFIMCICKSYFWCLEKIIRAINRNAYILVAIEGKPFCPSAILGLKIVLSNITQVMAVDVIGDFMLFLGKFFITLFVSLICGAWLSGIAELRFWLIPWLICFLLSWGISSMFMAVVELCIDTIMICFIIDRDMHGDDMENSYMSIDLKEKMDGFAEEHEKRMAAKEAKKGGVPNQE